MTTEVICSGCGATVPWPSGGVKTDSFRLTADASKRQVLMVDLKTGYLFHRCGYDLGNEVARRVAGPAVAGRSRVGSVERLAGEPPQHPSDLWSYKHDS